MAKESPSSNILTGKSMKRRKAFFSISAVAEMFAIHQQTIRLYEREGLITPKRSDGNTRLFSEDDVDRLEEIIYLTHKLGINIAGVQMILKLQKQMQKMQKDMNKIFDETRRDLTKEEELHKTQARSAARQLSYLKTAASHSVPNDPQIKADQTFSDEDSWEIEYEDS